MQVSDVVITDLKDGSYTIGFCLHQGGMLKFMVYVNGSLAPKCSLSKQVKWFISDVHGKGSVSKNGLTMNSVGGYCCRVGSCYFDSGDHTWKVELCNNGGYGYNPAILKLVSFTLTLLMPTLRTAKLSGFISVLFEYRPAA